MYELLNLQYVTERLYALLMIRLLLETELFTGKVGAYFPYKKVTDRSLCVSGIPPSCLPLKHPSFYGAEKLQLLLDCQADILLARYVIFNGVSVFRKVNTTKRA